MGKSRDIADIINTGTGTVFGGNNVEQGSDYTVVTEDRGRMFVSTTNITLNLTSASVLGNSFLFHVRAQTGNIIIDPDGVETIDGETTITITQGSGATIFCDGSGFFTNRKLSLPAIPGRIVNYGHGVDYTNYAINTTEVQRGSGIAITPTSNTSVLFFTSASEGRGRDTSSSTSYTIQRLWYYNGSAYQVVPNINYNWTYIVASGASSSYIITSVPLNCILTQSERRSDNGDWYLTRTAYEHSGDSGTIDDYSWTWLEIEM